jgi:hypothetical protein
MEMRSATVGRRSGGLGIDFEFAMAVACGGRLFLTFQLRLIRILCEDHSVALRSITIIVLPN